MQNYNISFFEIGEMTLTQVALILTDYEEKKKQDKINKHKNIIEDYRKKRIAAGFED